MLGFFCPLEKSEWIRTVMGLFREPWFWGGTNREVACQQLASQPRGTFLIRYASEDSYYTISYVASNAAGKKEIFHTRILHHYGSNHYQLPTTRNGSRTCSSLQEVVFALSSEGPNKVSMMMMVVVVVVFFFSCVSSLCIVHQGLINSPCQNGPFVSFFSESSVDSGYGFVGGYQAADVYGDDSIASAGAK